MTAAVKVARVMWAAAVEFAFCALTRGCEIALMQGERFEESEHITPEDVELFSHGGNEHSRVKMRKRKDLRVLRGKHDRVVLAGGGSILQPVTRLRAWLAARRRPEPTRAAS